MCPSRVAIEFAIVIRSVSIVVDILTQLGRARIRNEIVFGGAIFGRRCVAVFVSSIRNRGTYVVAKDFRSSRCSFCGLFNGRTGRRTYFFDPITKRRRVAVKQPRNGF